MQIGIIGAGKVGTTLGKYVKLHGACVTGFYSRTKSSGQESAEFTGTKYFETLDSLMEVSDTLFITTTDAEIGKVWDCIAGKNVKGKVICHFSGSLSSDIFSNWEETGAYACSVHPIYAFTDKFTAYQNLTGAAFAAEGDRTALDRMQELFRLLPNRVVEVSTKEKAKYHAATSIASNHVVGLISMAVGLMGEAGIPEASAYELLRPLVENNVKAIFAEPQGITASGAGEKAEPQVTDTSSAGQKAGLRAGTSCTGQKAGCRGCAQALTGPIERNDTETVREHLAHMGRQEWETAYRAVGTVVTELAEGKHPERSYSAMKKILGHV